jgi:ABC-2 type transport system permease protein
MLWYKAWLETRWRFLIGLAVLLVFACGAVFDYPAIARLNASVSAIDAPGSLGRLIREAAETQRTYRGFIWFQWYRQNLVQMWTILAVLLGSGGLLAASSRAALFALSMPASRARVAGVRAATALMELLVLALVPSLLIPLLSPAVGQHYGLGDTAVHSVSLFLAGSVFFSLAFLLSAVFDDLWRPMLITCAVALSQTLVGALVGLPFSGMLRVMSAESYFRSGQVPWVGLGLALTAGLLMLYAAVAVVERRDF